MPLTTDLFVFHSVPIALEMLFRRRDWLGFITWVSISAAVILLPMIWIDSMYYGKLVIAPLNILLYNVFTSHGPNLYGTEPFSYYLINGFLNFNFVFIGALLTPLFLVSFGFFIKADIEEKAVGIISLISASSLEYSSSTAEALFMFAVLVLLSSSLLLDCCFLLFATQGQYIV